MDLPDAFTTAAILAVIISYGSRLVNRSAYINGVAQTFQEPLKLENFGEIVKNVTEL